MKKILSLILIGVQLTGPAALAAANDDDPFVLFAEEDGAGEVAGFDAVHIDDEEMADAQEGEVFNDFVAQCASADDEDAGGGDFFLVPPLDGAEAGEALFGKGNCCR